MNKGIQHTGVCSYDDLYEAIGKMTPEQRKQPVQTARVSATPLTTCDAVLAIGTVEAFDFTACRSSEDNKYHGDEVVILVEGNPFGVKGEIGYRHDKNATGDFFQKLRANPVYGVNGPMGMEDYMSPRAKAVEEADKNGEPTVFTDSPVIRYLLERDEQRENRCKKK